MCTFELETSTIKHINCMDCLFWIRNPDMTNKNKERDNKRLPFCSITHCQADKIGSDRNWLFTIFWTLSRYDLREGMFCVRACFRSEMPSIIHAKLFRFFVKNLWRLRNSRISQMCRALTISIAFSGVSKLNRMSWSSSSSSLRSVFHRSS